MKKNVRFLLVFALLASFFWGCSKDSGLLDSSSLKLVINQNAMNLNRAVGKISSTQAYSILTVSDGTLKSETLTDSIYRVYIGLDLIKGLYEYKPVKAWDRWGFSLIRYFEKTADSNIMVVKMPLLKVKSPWKLRHYSHSDSTLKNNFTIAVSDYFNNYNSYWDYEYLLDSKISIDDAEAGSLYMKSLVSPVKGRHYQSQYAFTDGYTAKYKFHSGDTTEYNFALMDGDVTLYGEQRVAIKNDTLKHHREFQYTLTIGNVQIVRKSGLDSALIYVDGVLQPNAYLSVIDKDDDDDDDDDDEYGDDKKSGDHDGDNDGDQEASCMNKRDIQITFEDGTTTTISALIANSVDDIRTIFRSLHQVYFAAVVVDWIAYDIYYHRD